MEKYENQGLVGEGSYGMVLKCKHKDTGQLVAIKKFLESEDDKMVKKIAMREIKMLKQLRHSNLVNLLEVFRRKKRLYLVFEFVDHTVLDELEKCPNGFDETTCRKILWQVLKGIEFCHLNNIIHRDIKPENILVSKNGVVKLCDFGFARALAQPGETYTDYVATRWYRAPELLVGDTKYGKAVDIWAVGCLLVEMLTGEPLFPGDSDIDQLYHIVKVFGNLTARHKEIFLRNPLFVGMRLPEVREIIPLEKKFTRLSPYSLGFIKDCLRLEPDDRPTCSTLLKHDFFTWDGFAQKFAHDLGLKLARDQEKTAMLSSIVQDKDDDKEKADNDKAASRKKKKIIPNVKKDSKTDTEHIKKPDIEQNKTHTKTESKDVNKTVSKEEAKTSGEDKSKCKLPDPPDKGSTKKTPLAATNAATPPSTDPRSKKDTIVPSLGIGHEKSIDKNNKTVDKVEKSDKQEREKIDKVQKSFNIDVKVHSTDNLEQASRSENKNDENIEVEREKIRIEKMKEKSDREKEFEYVSDCTSDNSMEKLNIADSKEDNFKNKGDVKHEKEKREKQDIIDFNKDEHQEHEKENMFSFKDSPTIPPIFPSGHNHQNAVNVVPTIPSISRANDKMVKKQSNYKKTAPNYHSMTINSQLLQSEKSHLHDKSLEKLRTQKRETTMLDVRRDKELVTFPEVRGAEAAPVKSKMKQHLRTNVATIPHITHLDPFQSANQIESHSSEKSNENFPSM